jgi:manganese transport protein
VLIHVVESAGALFMKNEIRDYEFMTDMNNLNQYSDELNSAGYSVSIKIGYGNPKKSIPDLVKEFNADLLVMGAHGHKGIKDMILGTTVDAVRHRIGIPLLIVRK